MSVVSEMKRLSNLEANVEETESLDFDSRSMADQALMSKVLKNRRFSLDTEDRSVLARKTFWLIVAWLSCVVILLAFNSLWFRLSDSVLLMLLGTTTINIIGLAAIVLNGYFKHMNQNTDI